MKLRINWIAIVVCTILMQIIPMIWYGQIFRQSWMSLNNLTDEFVMSHQDGAIPAYICGFVGALIGVYMLARLFVNLNVTSAMRGALLGLSIGFAFTIMPLMSVNLFSYHPYALSWINGGQFTLGYTVSGIILALWRKTEG